MDTDNAWQIITTLASGVDPITGEIQPADSTLQHPDIVRALYVASMALQERLGNSSNRRAARPERAGLPGAMKRTSSWFRHSRKALTRTTGTNVLAGPFMRG